MRITYGFSVFMLILATLVSLSTPWVITNFFDERYMGAIPFIPWLSFSFAFFGMFFTVVHYLFFYKKTVRLSLITLSSGIMNSVLSYFLIPHFGPIAAAWSSLVSFGFMFIAVAIYANRVHPMPWTRFKAILS
jgi:O-antigen/teichoic acid export membrane protein